MSKRNDLTKQERVYRAVRERILSGSYGPGFRGQIPHPGAVSVAEHRALIELIAPGPPAAEIEAAARKHKLQTVESFRAWKAEHQL